MPQFATGEVPSDLLARLESHHSPTTLSKDTETEGADLGDGLEQSANPAANLAARGLESCGAPGTTRERAKLAKRIAGKLRLPARERATVALTRR